MKKLVLLLGIFSLFSLSLYSAPDLSNNDYKIIMSSQNMKDEKEELMGGFDKLEDMKRIKGIGDATYQKLSKVFKVGSEPNKKMLNINSANEITLKYYGFSKKEIKKIQKYLDKNDRITDNIEFQKIVNKKTYERLKDLINYDGGKR